ncbi:MAG: hypothetical protein O9972_21065 [Burkholderiales bacterium]|nr:hypothetical protein [Burkholderiales bacterium]
MAEARAGDVRGVLRAGLATAAALAVAGLVGIVFERLGAPGVVIAGLATALVLLLIVFAGLTGGTMRLPVYLTSGRAMSVTAAALAIGASAATALGGGAAATTAGLLAAALLFAPALRAAGMPGLAGWLGHRFGDPMLRMLAAFAVAAVAILAASARLGDVGAALAAGLGLPRSVAAMLAAGACALVLLPGGLSGAVRAGLCAALVAAATLPVASSAAAMADAVSRVSGTGDVAWLAVAVAALSPQVAVSVSACRSPADARLALLGAAAVAGVFGIALAAGGAPGGLFPAVGGVALRLSLDMAAMIALLHAAGAALGYELRGRLDRRRHPTSKRFAVLRLVTLCCIVAAAWLSLQDAARSAAMLSTATAVLVATVGPPLLIGVLVARAGRWGGLLACVGGLATVALLLEGRLAPGVDLEGAALAGLAAGLLAGLLPTLLMRAAPRPQPVDDASL